MTKDAKAICADLERRQDELEGIKATLGQWRERQGRVYFAHDSCRGAHLCISDERDVALLSLGQAERLRDFLNKWLPAGT